MSDSHLVDPLGRVLILYDQTWDGHIVDGHPEVAQHRDLVESAIMSPLAIRLSLRDANCRLYYGSGPRRGVMIQVVADMALGLIKTAHLTRRFSGGNEEWSSLTPSKG